MRTGSTAAAALSGALLLAPAAAAQAPVGPEWQVNAAPIRYLGPPQVSVNPSNGAFVVIWATPLLPGYRILGRRFNAAGGQLGSEFDVSTGTSNSATAAVVHDAAGNFIVAWDRFLPAASGEVIARRFDAGANPGPEIRVNAHTTGQQTSPTLVTDASGNFTVVWRSLGQDGDDAGLVGQRFDGVGNRLGGEFLVNTSTLGRQSGQAMAADAEGNFVVAWNDTPDPDVGTTSLVAQRFAASGARVGGEFAVGTGTQPSLRAVAAASDGRFVVTWIDYENVHSSKVVTRRFDASGAPLEAPSVLRTFARAFGRAPAAMNGAGRFVVMWDDDDYGYARVAGQRYEADGSRRQREFTLALAPQDDSHRPSLASDRLGRMVAAWNRKITGGETTVRAQRFGLLAASGLEVDTTPTASSDGNGVLEPGETIDLRPSWQNNSGGPQALAGLLSGLTGPPGATYTMTDATGDYGPVPDGATRACFDCYQVSVSAPAVRPRRHWDLRVRETIGNPDAGHADRALHVGDTFSDVPRTSIYYRFIEALMHHGIDGSCSLGHFCPSNPITRAHVAPWLLMARENAQYHPEFCATSPFLDVPVNAASCREIRELVRRGVTAGCGGGNYCPTAPVLREQMAVFLLRTLDPNLDPPACTTPLFGDVPASSPYCRWIEELARRGVVSGCGFGNYCPTDHVTREQMTVFVTQTFGLPLYGP